MHVSMLVLGHSGPPQAARRLPNIIINNPCLLLFKNPGSTTRATIRPRTGLLLRRRRRRRGALTATDEVTSLETARSRKKLVSAPTFGEARAGGGRPASTSTQASSRR
jgi:hypothetical protein